MSYDERLAQAKAVSAAGGHRVSTVPPPPAQKFPPGARVKIAAELGPSMKHFPSGRLATVQYTYAHAFGGDDVTSYSLHVDGLGSTAWYKEHQLTLVDEARESVMALRQRVIEIRENQ